MPISPVISGGSPTSGPGALALKLTSLADKATGAASDIAPDYLFDPTATPTDDFLRGARTAEEVRSGVDQLKAEIAIHVGTEGLTAAERSLHDLDAGLAGISAGIVSSDSHGFGPATAIFDEQAPKAASHLFESAANQLRGVAELAQFAHLAGGPEGMLDDAIRAGLRLHL